MHMLLAYPAAMIVAQRGACVGPRTPPHGLEPAIDTDAEGVPAVGDEYIARGATK